MECGPMKSILPNIFWTAAFWCGLGLLVLMCRQLWASDYPCQDTGFAGMVVGDIPTGQVIIRADNVYAASYSSTQYIFEFLPLSDAPPFNLLAVPLSSIVSANFYPATCTYFAEYEDDIFNNGFEGE